MAPSAASADVIDLGGSGWQVQSSAQATQSGATISDPRLRRRLVAAVRNDDGGAPGTEIEALVQNGACPNVYFSTNLKTCFGYMDTVGPDTVARFAVPWWYRTTFRARSRLRPAREPRRQRRGRPGRRLPQRPRGGHAGDGPGRLHPVQLRRHPLAAAGRQRGGAAACTPTIRRRCSRSTTSTGPRSRLTTTPASSSPCSCTPRERSR